MNFLKRKKYDYSLVGVVNLRNMFSKKKNFTIGSSIKQELDLDIIYIFNQIKQEKNQNVSEEEKTLKANFIFQFNYSLFAFQIAEQFTDFNVKHQIVREKEQKLIKLLFYYLSFSKLDQCKKNLSLITTMKELQKITIDSYIQKTMKKRRQCLKELKIERSEVKNDMSEYGVMQMAENSSQKAIQEHLYRWMTVLKAIEEGQEISKFLLLSLRNIVKDVIDRINYQIKKPTNSKHQVVMTLMLIYLKFAGNQLCSHQLKKIENSSLESQRDCTALFWMANPEGFRKIMVYFEEAHEEEILSDLQFLRNKFIKGSK